MLPQVESLTRSGGSVEFVSRLPAHELGQRAIDELRRHGVGTAHIARGGERIGEIVRTETFRDAAFRTRYLTQHIRFDLGEREKAGIGKFRELLAKDGFIAADARALIFV